MLSIYGSGMGLSSPEGASFCLRLHGAKWPSPLWWLRYLQEPGGQSGVP